MAKKFEDFDVQQAMRLAQSEEGRRLMAMLQSGYGEQVQKAMASAKQGDMAAAQKALADCLADPAAKALLQRMQEERNG